MNYQSLHEKLINAELPKNGEELLAFFTDSFALLMSNPDNVNALALTLSKAQLAAVEYQAENSNRKMQQLRLARVEYPGSIKGVVKIGEDEATVELFRRDVTTGEWGDVNLEQSAIDALTRLILSDISLTQDEVIYVTTEAAYAAELERVSLDALGQVELETEANKPTAH